MTIYFPEVIFDTVQVGPEGIVARATISLLVMHGKRDDIFF
ncbi:hypothetical protein [Microbulbifer marinus]|nr:hypothetical protein [Microbulbifer marinus]